MGFVVTKHYLKQRVMFGLFDCCLCPKQTIFVVASAMLTGLEVDDHLSLW